MAAQAQIGVSKLWTGTPSILPLSEEYHRRISFSYAETGGEKKVVGYSGSNVRPCLFRLLVVLQRLIHPIAAAVSVAYHCQGGAQAVWRIFLENRGKNLTIV